MTTPTNAEIRALRTAAAAAGDLVQVFICDVALGDEYPLDAGLDWEERFGGGGFSTAERRAMIAVDSAKSAREKCARVIADAAAQH